MAKKTKLSKLVLQRAPIPKSVRFEVLKRDSFTCQYCGGAAPNVLLQVDHIKAVASGGSGDITNLITSCQPCNAGKSDRPLSENAAVNKTKAQLDEIQKRREQLELLMQWHEGLRDMQGESISRVHEYWRTSMGSHYHLNEAGIQALRKIVSKFGISAALKAIDTVVDSYLRYKNGKPTEDSVEAAFDKIAGVCAVNRDAEKDPELRDLMYIRAIVRNRLEGRYFISHTAMQWLRAAISWGVTIDELKEGAKRVGSWREFDDLITALVELAKDEGRVR